MKRRDWGGIIGGALGLAAGWALAKIPAGGEIYVSNWLKPAIGAVSGAILGHAIVRTVERKR